MDSQVKAHFTATDTWMRLLFILVFSMVFWVTKVVLGLVIVIQFLTLLFTGNKNERLLRFGSQLSQFVLQLVLYLTFNTDDKPFPFGDWPAEVLKAKPKTATKPKPRKKAAVTAKKKTATKPKED